MCKASIIKTKLLLHVCCSTQTIAGHMAECAAEGLLVQSDYQTHGQGQRGHTWQAAAGENLLFTLLLRPTFLVSQHVFLLNIATALSLYDLLAPFKLSQLSIKWPNDIYIGEKKVAGTLVESKLQHGRLRYALLGIGLNVNQIHFSSPRASSLTLQLGQLLDKERLLDDWGRSFAVRYAQLHYMPDHQLLLQDYQQHLFAKGQIRTYKTATGNCFTATILGIDDRGHLQLQTDKGIAHFLPDTLQYFWQKH